MPMKIRLDTLSDATEFANIAAQIGGYVVLTDRCTGLRVNGKSILGVLHAMEFSDIWVESNDEIYGKIRKFIIED